jgi:uncharacterized protein (DUF2147 family)
MKCLFPAAVLITLGSPVHAADSFSFAIGGHRIHIETSGHCRSGSCVSISDFRIAQKRTRPDDGDRRMTTAAIAPAPPAVCAPPRPLAAPVQQVAPPPVAPPQVLQITPPVQQPRIQPVPVTATPPVKTAGMIAPAPLPQSPPPEIAPPTKVMPPVFNNAPQITKVSNEIDDEPVDTPLGDWHPEGQKGLVRIEPCGQALCGYTVDAASHAKGESVLVDMKSKTASKWSGNIYSRDSGNTYYGTIAMKGSDALEVEACAVGHFFCSGTVWKRADAKPRRWVTDRETMRQPRT